MSFYQLPHLILIRSTEDGIGPPRGNNCTLPANAKVAGVYLPGVEVSTSRDIYSLTSSGIESHLEN